MSQSSPITHGQARFADQMERVHNLEDRDPHARAHLLGVMFSRWPDLADEALTLAETWQEQNR